MITLKRRSMDYFVSNLRIGTPFAFSRYGDGEWHVLLGNLWRKNSNGCMFSPRLHDELAAVVRRQSNYDYALLRIARRSFGPRITRWLQDNECNQDWYLGDVLLEASLKGSLGALVTELRNKRILYIGPAYLRRLVDQGWFDVAAWVIPPLHDAIEEKGRIMRETAKILETQPIDFVGLSSGIHAKVFLDEIWNMTGGKIQMIDFGSIWDGYCRVQSRSYIRRGKYDFDQLRRENCPA